MPQPAMPQPAMPEPAMPEPAMLEPARSRVLVVEDDRDLLELAELALRRAGHDVTEVDSVEAAVAALAQATFDVVVSDIVLPGASGLTLVEGLGRSHPGLPVILTTGRTDPALRVTIEATGRPFLPKPYRLTDLCDAVAAVLPPAGPPGRGTAR